MAHRYASDAAYYTSTPQSASWGSAMLAGNSPRINRGAGRGETERDIEEQSTESVCRHLYHGLATRCVAQSLADYN